MGLFDGDAPPDYGWIDPPEAGGGESPHAGGGGTSPTKKDTDAGVVETYVRELSPDLLPDPPTLVERVFADPTTRAMVRMHLPKFVPKGQSKKLKGVMWPVLTVMLRGTGILAAHTALRASVSRILREPCPPQDPDLPKHQGRDVQDGLRAITNAMGVVKGKIAEAKVRLFLHKLYNRCLALEADLRGICGTRLRHVITRDLLLLKDRSDGGVDKALFHDYILGVVAVWLGRRPPSSAEDNHRRYTRKVVRVLQVLRDWCCPGGQGVSIGLTPTPPPLDVRNEFGSPADPFTHMAVASPTPVTGTDPHSGAGGEGVASVSELGGGTPVFKTASTVSVNAVGSVHLGVSARPHGSTARSHRFSDVRPLSPAEVMTQTLHSEDSAAAAAAAGASRATDAGSISAHELYYGDSMLGEHQTQQRSPPMQSSVALSGGEREARPSIALSLKQRGGSPAGSQRGVPPAATASSSAYTTAAPGLAAATPTTPGLMGTKTLSHGGRSLKSFGSARSGMPRRPGDGGTPGAGGTSPGRSTMSMRSAASMRSLKSTKSSSIFGKHDANVKFEPKYQYQLNPDSVEYVPPPSAPLPNVPKILRRRGNDIGTLHIHPEKVAEVVCGAVIPGAPKVKRAQSARGRTHVPAPQLADAAAVASMNPKAPKRPLTARTAVSVLDSRTPATDGPKVGVFPRPPGRNCDRKQLERVLAERMLQEDTDELVREEAHAMPPGSALSVDRPKFNWERINATPTLSQDLIAGMDLVTLRETTAEAKRAHGARLRVGHVFRDLCGRTQELWDDIHAFIEDTTRRGFDAKTVQTTLPSHVTHTMDTLGSQGEGEDVWNADAVVVNVDQPFRPQVVIDQPEVFDAQGGDKEFRPGGVRRFNLYHAEGASQASSPRASPRMRRTTTGRSGVARQSLAAGRSPSTFAGSPMAGYTPASPLIHVDGVDGENSEPSPLLPKRAAPVPDDMMPSLPTFLDEKRASYVLSMAGDSEMGDSPRQSLAKARPSTATDVTISMAM